MNLTLISGEDAWGIVIKYYLIAHDIGMKPTRNVLIYNK